MRLLVIDPEGSSGPRSRAASAYRDGHDVKLAIRQTEKQKLRGRGFVEVVPDPREWFRWSNLIVNCDNSVYIRDLDQHRKTGGLAISACATTAEWEIDRGIGQGILKKAGIPTLQSVVSSTTTTPPSSTSPRR